MFTAPEKHLAQRYLAMTFVDATATNLGLPHPIVQRATRKLLALLRTHAPEADVQTMISALGDLAELDPGAQPSSQLTRLFHGVRRFTTGARTTRVSLQATGLGNDDVAFASAFADYLREHLGESLASGLIASVPGLDAMSSWPLHPHKTYPSAVTPLPPTRPDLKESSDSARPKPPTMS